MARLVASGRSNPEVAAELGLTRKTLEHRTALSTSDRRRVADEPGARSGALVYDNALESSDDVDAANPQALAGGSIVVHK